MRPETRSVAGELQGRPRPKSALPGLLASMSLLSLLSLGGCALPRDPDGTLERLSREPLRVGASEHAPWVMRRGDRAVGIEAELVEGFARSLGTKVEYYWGPPAAHLRALKQQALELAIGGFDSSSPWQGSVGFSRPFYLSEIRVGYPHAPRLELIQGLSINYRSGTEIAGLLRAAGAHPIGVKQPGRGDGPLAAPVWELRRLGLIPGNQILARREHVLALSPGANRFLYALDAYLYRQRVDPVDYEAPRTARSAPLPRAAGPRRSS